ncbi:MAG: PorV/PorQ family protein [Ignavibacteria bacterium]|nr:PorV/PorQ family protein [Ignavibacteria bacterium]
MKNVIRFFAVLIVLINYQDSFSQNYKGTLSELFFGRQPSARAEAMGRGFVSVTGDALSYFYNPAGTASLQGLSLSGSFTGKYYLLDSAKYNFFSASYKIMDYGTVGFSRDYFTYGHEVVITDEFGNITGSYEPYVTNYRLTLSSEVIKEFYVGLNLNLLKNNTGSEVSVGNERSNNGDVFYFDLGVIKSFNIKSGKLNHLLNAGSSLINVNSASFSSVDASQKDKLPVIFRIGASYDLSIDDKNIISKLNSYNILLNLEYMDLFNSKYFAGFHSGMEFTFLEILSLRGGYYTQKITEECSNCKDKINEFTYGLGLNIPVRQLSENKIPLEVKFDYVNLKQPTTVNDFDDWKNFQTFTFTAGWIF